jgi:hypothetical protein
MKTLPGSKLIAFAALIVVVELGVYAWAQSSPTPTPTPQSKFIVKFGWEGKNSVDVDPINYTPKEIRKYFKDHNIDSQHYKIRHYKNGDLQPSETDDGHSDACSDAAPTTPAASAYAEPSASGTPTAGAKTQTAGAASFSTPKQAQDFLTFLNAAPTPSPTPTPASTKAPKK